MRLISLLLSLAILGYVISIYLDSSSGSSAGNEQYSSRPQQTIEQAEDTAAQINQSLKLQQQQLQQADQ
ncbi:MAG: hypothetical protein PVH16_05060 [Thioalkalispiraceae bacterium]|jgi:hypothetical protein